MSKYLPSWEFWDWNCIIKALFLLGFLITCGILALNEPDFILLTSILNACRLTIADIALVNLGNQKASLHQILNNLPSKFVIAFEVDSKALKIKLPTNFYKLTPLGESNLLFSKSLSSMQGMDSTAKQEKAKLWAVLKQIFQL